MLTTLCILLLVRFRFRVLAVLERFFRVVERMAGEMAERCAYCPDCGRNRYRGAPCQNV